MTFEWSIFAAIGVLIIIGVLLTPKVSARVRFWQMETAKVQKGGYVPPAPHLIHALIMRSFCVLFGFLEVGPIKIIGKDRLPKKGAMIIAPFHTDAGDAPIVSHLLGTRPIFYLIRTTEVQGWRGYICAATGAIAVDEETQEGRSKAFKAAINALAGGGPDVCMVIFPQGELVPDQVVRRHEFKSGTMAIAKIAARKRKEPIWIVPVGMHYKTDPSMATLFQKSIEKLGFSKFRNLFGHKNYGAVAVVGKPFRVLPHAADLEEVARGLTLLDDAEQATDMYVQRLLILQREAKKRAEKRLKMKNVKSAKAEKLEEKE